MIPALLFQHSLHRRRRRTAVSKLDSCVFVLVLTVWLGLLSRVWRLSPPVSVVDRRVLKRPEGTAPQALAETATWRNRHNVVHVLHTRFMQHQPHLLHLGRARMNLLRTITLPSIQNQTTKEFLWMIRIDPDLHDELKEAFLQLVEDTDNLVVVLSNTNVEDFRRHGVDDVATEDCILGRTHEDRLRRFEVLKRYHVAAQSRLVLESRLDADDALSLDLMEWLQEEAYTYLHDDTQNESTESSFRVWCLGTTMEWQFYNPLDANSTVGSLVAFPYGHCVTPGITFGYQVEATADDPPTHKHHKLHKSIPSCDQGRQHNCLSVLRKADSSPLALRARTPTSAGMMNLFLSAPMDRKALQRFEQWNRFQRRAWIEVERLFGVHRSSVERLRRKIKVDLARIAADNALGQCTPGHSCKPSSQELLQKLQDPAPQGAEISEGK